ncbi:hypothetical protein M9H77_29509 [Catharanthus roseus]|uniref:Uncharacterized protein n=1 Tax=Catharanthus roseus TaxID=4058 RepID=A0ACB9ZX76_CATRO|nr:hypothetical protein M9H77_29509 [Catharanthus roseus]
MGILRQKATANGRLVLTPPIGLTLPSAVGSRMRSGPIFQGQNKSGQPNFDTKLQIFAITTNLVREFYTNMTHKTNKDPQTIISIVKGVRIILDSEHLASILGIPDTGNSVTMDSNIRKIDEDSDWNFDTACSHFEIQPGHWTVAESSMGDDNEADESYNTSDDEEDEAVGQHTILMDAFQTKTRTAFEQLCINHEIQGLQLMEIVESTCRYADELAY